MVHSNVNLVQTHVVFQRKFSHTSIYDDVFLLSQAQNSVIDCKDRGFYWSDVEQQMRQLAAKRMFPSALSIYSAIPSTHWSEKYQRSLMFAKCDYRCHWSCARPYKQCQGHRCVLLISHDGVTIIIYFTHIEMLHSIAFVNYLSFLFWSERSINSFRKLQ